MTMASIRSIRKHGQSRAKDALLERKVNEIVRRAFIRVIEDAWAQAIAKARRRSELFLSPIEAPRPA